MITIYTTIQVTPLFQFQSHKIHKRQRQLSRGGCWDPIIRFNPVTFVCLSQTRTCISSIICRGLFLVLSALRWEVIFRFVDIGRIVDHRCLNFFIKRFWHDKANKYSRIERTTVKSLLIVGILIFVDFVVPLKPRKQKSNEMQFSHWLLPAVFKTTNSSTWINASCRNHENWYQRIKRISTIVHRNTKSW